MGVARFAPWVVVCILLMKKKINLMLENPPTAPLWDFLHSFNTRITQILERPLLSCRDCRKPTQTPVWDAVTFSILLLLDVSSSSLHTQHNVFLCFTSFGFSFSLPSPSLLGYRGDSSCLPQSNVYRSASFMVSPPTPNTFSSKWVPFISEVVVNKIFPISLYVDKLNQAQDQRYIHLYFILASFSCIWLFSPFGLCIVVYTSRNDANFISHS